MITITIKCSNGEKAEVSSDASVTVAEFKVLISEKLSIPPGNQKLIYKGRMVKDDSTLEQYDIQDGHTIHLVKSGMAKPAPSPTQESVSTPAATAPSSVPGASSNPFSPPSGGAANPMAGLAQMMGGAGGMGGMGDMSQMQSQLMQNPEMMQQLMNSPMMESLMSNPELMTNMMLNNPQLQGMLDANPQIRHILRDPAMMRQTMQMMRNPDAMREAMRHQDLAMSQLENHPGGFNALRRMYEEVQEPMMEATQDAAAASASATQQQQQTNPWASGEPNTSALPNPWGARPAPASGGMGAGAANPFAGMGAGGGANPFAGMGGGGMPPGMAGMMNDPAQMAAMMQNPMVQQMLRDPQMMQQMARMDPNLSRMLDANPQMLQMLSDPEHLRRMSDPANLQAMMQMQQAMQQLQGSGMMPPIPGMPTAPGGFSAAPAAAPGATTIGGLDFSSLLGGGGGGGFAPAAPPAPSRSPEVQYEVQLQQLDGMGFTDRDANIRALVATNGNVNAAIERLLG